MAKRASEMEGFWANAGSGTSGPPCTAVAHVRAEGRGLEVGDHCYPEGEKPAAGIAGRAPIGVNLSPGTVIHAVLDESGASFYVAQGEMRENELFLRGLAVHQRKLNFPLQLTIALSQLERGDWIGGEAPRLRPHFSAHLEGN